MERRALFKIAALSSLAVAIPNGLYPYERTKSNFRFCLNTSTISGQSLGILRSIDIVSAAGYDGIELWVRDVKAFIDSGNKPSVLRKYLEDSGLKLENAIGFAPWLDGKEGMAQMKKEMEMMAGVGCSRIAAPALGLKDGETLDLFLLGEKYRQLIEVGKSIGVKPLLEFWGASKNLFHIGQALMAVAVANSSDASILADVYHMFRGNSGFDSLKMLKGDVLELFHMNDYISDIPREQQKDSDRVYPGDGVAPLKQILTDLKNMGGEKVLSLELFNRNYWQQDAKMVAKTGLDKMKNLMAEIS